MLRNTSTDGDIIAQVERRARMWIIFTAKSTFLSPRQMSIGFPLRLCNKCHAKLGSLTTQDQKQVYQYMFAEKKIYMQTAIVSFKTDHPAALIYHFEPIASSHGHVDGPTKRKTEITWMIRLQWHDTVLDLSKPADPCKMRHSLAWTWKHPYWTNRTTDQRAKPCC